MLDKENRLNYWLNEPVSWRREYSLPSKIRFQGIWRLNKNYDLELRLDKNKNQFAGDRLALKGEIISTDRDRLVFQLYSLDQKGQSHIQLLKLIGSWQADEYNRICFAVKKASPDILTLEGIWQISPNQQVIYTYDKTDLKTKTRISQALTFEGFWQITESKKLTYILSRSSRSRFDFRVQIESPNLYPQKGVIKYRLGIGLKESKPAKTKIISLYGTWKFSRQLGLIFQIDYGRGKRGDIIFGSDFRYKKRNKIALLLKNITGEPLGMEFTFTRKFARESDAELFLELKKFSRKESSVSAGMSIPF